MVAYVEVEELDPINTLEARPKAWFDVSPIMVRVRSDVGTE